MGFTEELSAMRRWVDDTDPIALAHFASAVPATLKADGTPVTAGDRAVEDALRGFIGSEFPGDAVIGEEQGAAGTGERRWIIDPIDGTKNYARQVPVFATLIALEDADGLAAGVVSAPALGTRWYASRGGGAFCDGAPIRVSSVSTLSDAHVCSGGLDWAERALGGDGDALMRLLGRAARHRGFGDFWGYMLVAQGSMEAMVEFAPLALWDIAAPRLILEEAGGRWTGTDGSKALAPGPAVATNGHIHDEVLDVLSRR